MKYYLPFLTWVLLCTFLVPGVWAGPRGSSGSYQASAKRQPWSGYWWSMDRGELVLGWNDGAGRKEWSVQAVLDFDRCVASYTPSCKTLIEKMAGKDGSALSPLMKFDYSMRKFNEKLYGPNGGPPSAYTRASKWELDNHYIGGNPSHRYYGSRGFAGKCIGWALSTLDYDEPTKTKIINGVILKPADIKGILASIYNGAQFFVPDDGVIGNAYYAEGGTPQDYADVLPHDLLRALSLTVDKGQILEADLDPGVGVWNYPIHRYEMSWRPGRAGVIVGEMTLYFANDEVGIDEIFTTNPARPDIISRKLTFELSIPPGWNGNFAIIKKSRWTGKSIDEHPDAVILSLESGWRKMIYDYKNTQVKEEVNFQLIKRINPTGRGWVPFVDTILEQYYRR